MSHPVDQDRGAGAPRPRVRRTVARFLAAVPEYLTFELTNRLVMALVIVPLTGGATALLATSRAGGVVTNATIGSFLISWQGALFGLLVLALVAWLVIVELGGAIVVADRRRTGQAPARWHAIVAHNLRRASNLAGAGSPLLLLYVVIVLPLAGWGFAPSELAVVAVPTFVLAVIESTPTLFAAYLALLAVLALVALVCSYTLPLILLGNLRAWPAIRTSGVLVAARPGVLLRRYLLPLAGGATVVTLIAGLWYVVVALGLDAVGSARWWGPVLAGMLLWQQFAVLIVSMLLLPYQAHCLVDAYRAALHTAGPLAALADRTPQVTPRPTTSPVAAVLRRGWRWLGGLAAVALVVTAAAAVPLLAALDTLVEHQGDVKVVGHRAGGRGVLENSLAGLDHAVAEGADLVEIDVQRTADGAYVLQHDDTFARLTGESRTSSQLTLAEVQSLRLLGSDQHVPTLEEFLTAARGRVGVVIELKGATADQRMGDDVVRIVDRLGMRDDVILMSLNYPLIQYLEGVHPQFTTGFAYFWSLGDVSLLTADVIMFEEREATAERSWAITAAGKQAFVWTINDPGTMDAVLSEGVTGVITDDVPMATAAVVRHGDRTTDDVLGQLFGVPRASR